MLDDKYNTVGTGGIAAGIGATANTTAGVTAGTKVGELSDVDDLSLDCL